MLTTHAVQRHASLLALRLDRHGLEVRLLSSHPDRLRVHGVGLVAQQEGLDVLGRQQLDLVPQGTDHPRPVVGCAARLHRN